MMETHTNNALLSHNMYMNMHTHKWSHKGTSKYTSHTCIHNYTLRFLWVLSHIKQKLLCSSLSTYNTSKTTELKKDDTYSSVLYTMFQMSSLFIPI